MGYSKKLYNVLGGVTSSIIAYATFCVNTHDSQILQFQSLIFVHFAQSLFKEGFRRGIFPFKQ